MLLKDTVINVSCIYHFWWVVFIINLEKPRAQTWEHGRRVSLGAQPQTALYCPMSVPREPAPVADLISPARELGSLLLPTFLCKELPDVFPFANFH